MKQAHQDIYQRQKGRLETFKQQMKESLVQTKSINNMLQKQDSDPKSGNMSNFNNLVLGFT